MSQELPEIILGVNGRSDGSCRWSYRGTKVLSSIRGPTAPTLSSQTLSDVAYIDIQVLTDTVGDKSEDLALKHRENKVVIKQFIYSAFKNVILDFLHPRSQITITVQIVKDNGSLLSACINATTLALMNAGISVSDFVSSTTIAVLDNEDSMQHEDKFVIHPSVEDISQAVSVGYFAYRGDGVQVAHYLKSVYHKGKKRSDEQFEDYWSAVDLAKEECSRVCEIQKKAIYDRAFVNALASEDQFVE